MPNQPTPVSQPPDTPTGLSIVLASFGAADTPHAFVDRIGPGNAMVTVVSGHRHISFSGDRLTLQRLVVDVDNQLSALAIRPEGEDR